MAELAISCVIQTITEILLHEAKYLPAFRGRIEVIQMKLRQLQSILEIADASQEVDEGIRSWIAETREVAYDVEDLLLVAVSSKNRSFLRKYTHAFKELRNHTESKFQVIEAKISALESDLRVRNVRPQQKGVPKPVSQRSQQRRRTYSYHLEEDFVGFEEDVADLVTHLVKRDGYHVLSLTGMGGIGKTTVAKRIYHHPDVRQSFHAFAWVCVSQQWERNDVLQRILNKLEPDKRKEINDMKTDELVEELYKIQRAKRCLIVMDDVWQKDVWDMLRHSFPSKQINSKILLTTRNKEIACYIAIHHSCYLYEQRHLNEKESWELLEKKVCQVLDTAGLDKHYANESEDYSGAEDEDSASSAESFHSCNTVEEDDEAIDSPQDCIQDQQNRIEMEKLGKAMVRQCGGLPLAVIVLGGLLMTKSTVGEWRTVHQNLNSYLRRAASSEENGRVHEVLALSYHDLPYHLKPCFLHLGNFPEDSNIPTHKLYQLWAAEGFVPVMDVAEHYLHELVQRSMVEVRVEEATGRYKSCQLHDLTRELCLLKGKEENFLKKLPVRHARAPQNIVSLSSPKATTVHATRRLSIIVDQDDFSPSEENLERIRSAMFFSSFTDRRNLLPTLNWVCDELKLLRVLDLERFDFGAKLDKGVGKLVHLKYLSLRGSLFYKLPSSIGNLKYLLTLDLRVPFLVTLTLPNVIWKLSHLKHLYLPPSHNCSSAKLQLSNLTRLEILKNFDTRVSGYRDILKLTNVQKLAAIVSLDLENLEILNNFLKTESNPITESSFRIRYDFQSDREIYLFQELVGHSHLRKLDQIGSIGKLPEHIHFAQSLTELTLRGSRLKEDPMATLEKLHNLYSLRLRKNAYEGNELRCSSQGFSQLRNIEIQGLISLENWIIDEGAMPNLQNLCIDECINLKMVPEGIKFVITLQKFVIANMPENFKHRVQNVHEEDGEDIYKVEHIPTFRFTEISNLHTEQLERQLSGKPNSGILLSISPVIIPKDWYGGYPY